MTTPTTTTQDQSAGVSAAAPTDSREALMERLALDRAWAQREEELLLADLRRR